MSGFLTAVVGVSLIVLLVISAFWARKTGDWRRFCVELGGLLLFAGFLHVLFNFPVPAAVVAKGPLEDVALAVALYICMLAGMLAQFLYRHFEEPRRKRRKFDWGLFAAPVFASPIVFIPLMVALQNANLDLKNLNVPRMMIFFVAFQNGFFWKEHFDRKRKEAEIGEK